MRLSGRRQPELAGAPPLPGRAGLGSGRGCPAVSVRGSTCAGITISIRVTGIASCAAARAVQAGYRLLFSPNPRNLYLLLVFGPLPAPRPAAPLPPDVAPARPLPPSANGHPAGVRGTREVCSGVPRGGTPPGRRQKAAGTPPGRRQDAPSQDQLIGKAAAGLLTRFVMFVDVEAGKHRATSSISAIGPASLSAGRRRRTSAAPTVAPPPLSPVRHSCEPRVQHDTKSAFG